MDYITLKQAAEHAGYKSTSTLKAAAASGALKTVQPAPNLRLTTRKWVDDYLRKHPRPEQGMGKGRRGVERGPRKLPADQPEAERAESGRDRLPFALRPMDLSAEEGEELERRLATLQPHPTWRGQDVPAPPDQPEEQP